MLVDDPKRLSLATWKEALSLALRIDTSRVEAQLLAHEVHVKYEIGLSDMLPDPEDNTSDALALANDVNRLNVFATMTESRRLGESRRLATEADVRMKADDAVHANLVKSSAADVINLQNAFKRLGFLIDMPELKESPKVYMRFLSYIKAAEWELQDLKSNLHDPKVAEALSWSIGGEVQIIDYLLSTTTRSTIYGSTTTVTTTLGHSGVIFGDLRLVFKSMNQALAFKQDTEALEAVKQAIAESIPGVSMAWIRIVDIVAEWETDQNRRLRGRLLDGPASYAVMISFEIAIPETIGIVEFQQIFAASQLVSPNTLTMRLQWILSEDAALSGYEVEATYFSTRLTKEKEVSTTSPPSDNASIGALAIYIGFGIAGICLCSACTAGMTFMWRSFRKDDVGEDKSARKPQASMGQSSSGAAKVAPEQGNVQIEEPLNHNSHKADTRIYVDAPRRAKQATRAEVRSALADFTNSSVSLNQRDIDFFDDSPDLAERSRYEEPELPPVVRTAWMEEQQKLPQRRATLKRFGVRNHYINIPPSGLPQNQLLSPREALALTNPGHFRYDELEPYRMKPEEDFGLRKLAMERAPPPHPPAPAPLSAIDQDLSRQLLHQELSCPESPQVGRPLAPPPLPPLSPLSAVDQELSRQLLNQELSCPPHALQALSRPSTPQVCHRPSPFQALRKFESANDQQNASTTDMLQLQNGTPTGTRAIAQEDGHIERPLQGIDQSMPPPPNYPVPSHAQVHGTVPALPENWNP